MLLRMSSAERQRRPTREATRSRLLDAAADVFIERGISASSVEDIADAAGFSRGAVYSNFADKNALVLALLQRASDQSIEEIETLLADYPDPDDYIRATQDLMVSPTRRGGHHHPVLSTELVLYAMRNPDARPLLRERRDRTVSTILKVIERNANALGLRPADNRQAVAAMIVAMDDGFGLHGLIDPTFDSVEAFSVALDFIAEAGAAIAFTERHGTTRRPTRPSARQSTTPER